MTKTVNARANSHVRSPAYRHVTRRRRFTRAARLQLVPDNHKREQLSVVTMADDDPKLFDQCRICIVCSNDLPLETAEQVCITTIACAYTEDETHILA